MIVGFAQSVAIAKAFAVKNREPLDANQELIGYGAANLGAGALQGYAVTGSLSKSADSVHAGGKSPPLLLLVTSGLVVLTVMFLDGLFKDLPETILAAIVIQAVWGMIDFSKLTRLWHARLGEFWLAVGALAGVVIIGVLAGVLIGVALSFMLLITRVDHPRVAILGRSRDGRSYTELTADSDATPIPGVLIYPFRAPLVFANAEIFTDDLTARVQTATPPPTTVILACDGISEIDTTGADALRQIHETLSASGTRMLLARVNSGVLDLLHRDYILQILGDDAVFPTVRDAVAATAELRAPRRRREPKPVRDRGTSDG